jgi:hypothetical protein
MMAPRLWSVAIAAGLLLGSWPAQATTLACRSAGGYERCAASTAGGVVLQHQLGGTCTEGVTWGFDPGGVWVDRGCAAEFAVGPQEEGGALAQYGPALGVLGALAVLGTAVALSGDDDGNRGSSGHSGQRREQAIALCTDYAGRIVKDAGGRGARLDRLQKARADDDKWRIEAYVEARWADSRNPKRFMDCTVNFRGSNRVTAFRHDGLDQRPGGGGGGDWGGSGGSWGGGGGGGGGNWRDRAVLACQNEARRQGFSVKDVFDIKEHRKRYDMAMLLEKRRERVYADCGYEVDERQARLGNVGRSAGRG